MTDKKLTQLSAGSAIADADLFYSAPQAGGQVKQPASALRTYLLGGSGIRTLLTADLDLYVDPAGTDSNTGLTIGSPWLTIQHAFNYVMNTIDLANFYVNINLAAGTYNSGGGTLVMTGPIPGGSQGIRFVTSGAVTIDGAGGITIYIYNTGVLEFGGTGTYTITNSASGPGAVGIWVDRGGLVFQDAGATLNFGTIGTSEAFHITCTSGSLVLLNGPISISNTITIFAHINVDQNGALIQSGSTTTFSGSPTISATGGFLVANRNGSMVIFPQTYTGSSLTGRKALADTNGTIETFGQTLPGTIAAFTATGGQFQ